MSRFYSMLSCLLAAMLGISAPAVCCCSALAGAPPNSKGDDSCCGGAVHRDAKRDHACCPQPDHPTCCDGKKHPDGQSSRSSKDGCCKLSAPCRDAERPTRVAVKADRPSQPTHNALLFIAPLPAFAWLEPSASQHIAVTSPPLDQPPDCTLLNLGCLLTT